MSCTASPVLRSGQCRVGLASPAMLRNPNVGLLPNRGGHVGTARRGDYGLGWCCPWTILSFPYAEPMRSVGKTEPQVNRELDTATTVRITRMDKTNRVEDLADTVADEHTPRTGASGATSHTNITGAHSYSSTQLYERGELIYTPARSILKGRMCQPLPARCAIESAAVPWISAKPSARSGIGAGPPGSSAGA